jgi:regulator of sigma E protease
MTVIIFLIVLAVLIFVHEFGHFLLARLNGIRVDSFKIGFGPKLISWKMGETEYGINLIPFGGFVKIFGENPDEENTYGADKARSFVHKNRWRQASVLVAGVLFNFLFAWLLYVIVFASGVTATTDGFLQYASYFRNQRIMITYVEPNSPAGKAGLKMGDVIESVYLPVSISQPLTGKSQQDPPCCKQPPQKITDIQSVINSSKGNQVDIFYTDSSYKIGSEYKSIQVSPIAGLVPDKYAIGISMSDVVDLRLPFLTSIWVGLQYTDVMIRDTAVGLYTFVANIFQGTANFSDVAGPVGIAGIVGDAAQMGFKYLVMITALISINLGVINLIPFPALDGGRLLFVAIEGVFRRRISPKFTNAVNTVGFVLLMILMVVVTYKDIAKLVR